MEINREYFTRELYKELQKKASGKDNVRDKKIFDTYQYFIRHKRKLRSIDDLIVAISIAYSWMPTMLDIYDQSTKSLVALKDQVGKLKFIRSSTALIKKEGEVKEILFQLCNATNNSVVGASKVLHLFYPLHIPIFDSRVRRAWNALFNKGIQIPIITNKNQVNLFYNYWLGILYWREKLGYSDVRRIEKRLYTFGGFLLDKKRKKQPP